MHSTLKMGGSKILQNVGILMQHYMASQTKGLNVTKCSFYMHYHTQKP